MEPSLCCAASIAVDLHAEILDVHISAETHVIGEIPADVVRIVVDDDLIGVPEPAVAEGKIGCSNIPIPAVEPETGGASAGERQTWERPKPPSKRPCANG